MKKYITIKEAEARTSKSRSTIQRFIKKSRSNPKTSSYIQQQKQPSGGYETVIHAKFLYQTYPPVVQEQQFDGFMKEDAFKEEVATLQAQVAEKEVQIESLSHTVEQLEANLVASEYVAATQQTEIHHYSSELQQSRAQIQQKEHQEMQILEAYEMTEARLSKAKNRLRPFQFIAACFLLLAMTFCALWVFSRD